MFCFQQSSKSASTICPPLQVCQLLLFFRIKSQWEVTFLEDAFDTDASLGFEYSLLLVTN